ncbi:MAG: hypothetical protein KJ064_20915 [Anaerolineae bacterium]|jgi:hypothetical protein|nr:MAG: hypothetical protein F9K27_13340 [Anaerolineae bacterium]MCL4879131.1 hypothetical protein [Anaerolineae bacterium]
MNQNQQQYINQQLVQLGILISTLGIVLCLIGLYPGITGLEPKSGIGVLQIMIIILGMTLIIIGAMLFVKIGFYPSTGTNLAQRIAIRLSLTGLLLALAAGLADLLGYGSNPPEGPEKIPVLGVYQAVGMVVGFLVASLGVLLFALRGPHPEE